MKRIITIIFAIYNLLLIMNCGGASGGGLDSDDSNVDESTTVQQLLDMGITVEDDQIDDVLAGTWSVTSYDLGATSETIETSDEDPTITFPDNSDVASLGQFLTNGILFNVVANGELTDYSVPPLYDYEIGTNTYLGDNIIEMMNIYYCDESTHDRCECGDGDMICLIPKDQNGDSCEVTTNQEIEGSYCDREMFYVAYNEEYENVEVVSGLVDINFTYEIIDTGIDKILSIALIGTYYGVCTGGSPGECSDWTADGVEEIRESTYVIRGSTNRIIALESDDSYIILTKN